MSIGKVGRTSRERLALATLAAGAMFVASPACAQEFVMKFATQTINDVQHEFIKIYKAELEKATNIRIRVDIYPASQLGGAQRQAEGLRLGTIEAATGPADSRPFDLIYCLHFGHQCSLFARSIQQNPACLRRTITP